MALPGKEQTPNVLASADFDNVKDDLEKNPTHSQIAQENPDSVVIDPEIEARVVRKLDWRLPTLLWALCM